MDWWISLLQLLFGQLGVVGTVCFVMAMYIAYLHHQEREDHKATRVLMERDVERRATIHEQYIKVLAEMKLLLESLIPKR